MSKYVSNISRLNALYTALGIKLKQSKQRLDKLQNQTHDFEAPRGGFDDVDHAISCIYNIRQDILNVERSILDVRVFNQKRLAVELLGDPLLVAATIAAEFDLNGYIAEYADQLVDKDALYRVCYDVETEDYRQLNRTVIRDRLPYDLAFQIGKELATTLGLKESYFHGQWMTVMPCEIEETVKVVKS